MNPVLLITVLSHLVINQAGNSEIAEAESVSGKSLKRGGRLAAHSWNCIRGAKCDTYLNAGFYRSIFSPVSVWFLSERLPKVLELNIDTPIFRRKRKVVLTGALL